jgi:hypothetical protein
MPKLQKLYFFLLLSFLFYTGFLVFSTVEKLTLKLDVCFSFQLPQPESSRKLKQTGPYLIVIYQI